MTGDELHDAIAEIVSDGQPIGMAAEETADRILALLAGKRLVVSLEDDGQAAD